MRFILLLFFTTFSLYANDITVTIIYGDKPEKVIETTYKKGDTALSVLEKVSNITVSNGKYKFVRSINGKGSVPGSYGWFYLINGQETHKMASSYQLTDAVSMTWYYKVEQCN